MKKEKKTKQKNNDKNNANKRHLGAYPEHVLCWKHLIN